jgi:hypothetical protein
MKSQVLALSAGLALVIAAATPVHADEYTDPLAGATTLHEAQLENAKGSNPVPTQFGQPDGQSGTPGSINTDPTTLGSVGTSQTTNLTGAAGTLGISSLGPISGPINMGLNAVSGDIGVNLPTMPQ